MAILDENGVILETNAKKEAEDLLQTVRESKTEVVLWLEKNHRLIYSGE